MIIDLRSDTVTKPSQGMMAAMQAAPVGDDVFGEDPTINQLEAVIAEKFGMEAALFCLSGTMSNQIGIKCHTQPGDEVICEAEAHVYYYEAGGIASNSLAQVHTIKGVQGQINAQQVLQAINPNDIHKAKTSLVCLENTCNRGGGTYYDIDNLKAIKEVCSQHNLSLHLDGARLWNAAIAGQTDLKTFGQIFDSISVCFNKGLGCPMGSALLGTKAYIQKARKVRKAFGGGWRQAGILAAAVLYALEHNFESLATDHLHANQLANALKKCPWVAHVEPTPTNIVLFDVTDNLDVNTIIEQLAKQGILCFSTGQKRIRFVTHLQISQAQILAVEKVLHSM
jgi:threonine aldolase